MLISLQTLIKKHKLKINGVLHVGAHLAEEANDYRKAGIKNVAWVEADASLFENLHNIVPEHIVINEVVADKTGREVVFHKANNGQSSSVLELGTHKTAHPEIHYVSEETRISKSLNDIYEEHNLSGLNFMNLDIQGAELLALIGLGSKLDDFDYIYTEVNKEELYVGCCLVSDLDEFLSDFKRVETAWTEFGWGDAFYVRVR